MVKIHKEDFSIPTELIENVLIPLLRLHFVPDLNIYFYVHYEAEMEIYHVCSWVVTDEDTPIVKSGIMPILFSDFTNDATDILQAIIDDDLDQFDPPEPLSFHTQDSLDCSFKINLDDAGVVAYDGKLLGGRIGLKPFAVKKQLVYKAIELAAINTDHLLDGDAVFHGSGFSFTYDLFRPLRFSKEDPIGAYNSSIYGNRLNRLYDERVSVLKMYGTILKNQPQ